MLYGHEEFVENSFGLKWVKMIGENYPKLV